MDPTLAPAQAAHGLSFLALFLQADPIVKGVMAILALASLVCWTVIVEKLVRLGLARRQARTFERLCAAAAATTPRGRAGRIAAAGHVAWRDKDPSESRAERRERIERAMRGALSAEIRRLQIGLPFLATAASAAPFIGLFGTVWGIMNSFSAIAETQDTSLAVVAPGIAEALFATAIGLAVAIPAAIAYNKLATDLNRVQAAFAAGIAHLSDRLARDRGQRGLAEAAE